MLHLVDDASFISSIVGLVDGLLEEISGSFCVLLAAQLSVLQDMLDPTDNNVSFVSFSACLVAALL